jgi:hypothetical protein
MADFVDVEVGAPGPCLSISGIFGPLQHDCSGREREVRTHISGISR